MSWSVNAIGKPSAVKAHLETQFAAAKLGTEHIPQERDSVAAIEAAVNSQLDFLAEVPGIAVHVQAGGSAWKGVTAQLQGSATCNLKFETIYGFVES
jgi:hypothetical protein